MLKTPKAIIYTRVSTGAQAEDGTSLEIQEALCLRKAQEIGAQVVEIIPDAGVSGALYLSRPGIQKALKAIEAGDANRLITMKLDRSGRDVDALRLIRKRVTEAGGKLLFADGLNFENNAVGNLMFTQMAGYAEYEKEVIRERTMSGRRKRVQDGQQPCRAWSPFGYHVVTKEDVLTGTYAPETLGLYQIVEDQAPWIREIFARYGAGVSLRKLGQWLDTQGVPTPRGGICWHVQTLRQILLHPVYKGAPSFGRWQSLQDEARLSRGLKTHYKRLREAQDWLSLSAPALVSEATWEACQARLAGNQNSRSGNPSRRYALTGLVTCPHCGRKLAGSRNHGIVYYQCHKDGYCQQQQMHQGKKLEALIAEAILTVLRLPEMVQTALDAYHAHHQQQMAAPAERQRIDEALRALDKEEKAVVDAQIAGIMAGANVALYEARFADIAQKRAVLQAQISQFPEPTAPDIDTATLVEKVRTVLATVERFLTSGEATEEEKGQAYHQLLKGIHPQADGYTLELYPYLVGLTEQSVLKFLT